MITALVVEYVAALADRALVLSHRLTECLTHAPEIEEEVALANIALDLLGQARVLYARGGELEGMGRTEDDFAYWRTDQEFRSPLLVEEPNGDFAHVMMRQFLHDAWAIELWTSLRGSCDETVAGVAAKAVNETAYHLRHSSAWVRRLGDGTDESHARLQTALDGLWWLTGELFEVLASDRQAVAAGIGINPESLRQGWLSRVGSVLSEAGLTIPTVSYMATGGRSGSHSEALSRMLAEMQSVARAHPGAAW